MDRAKIVGWLIAALLLSGCSRERRLHVGSKSFTEQDILGEIIAQHMERRLHRTVRRTPGLGGTLFAQQALLTGQIDLYPEYTGTAFTTVLKQTAISDQKAVLQRLRAEYGRRMKLEWLDPLGFDNSFAMVVRGEDARNRHLTTLSDATQDAAGFALGAGYEFLRRPDGYKLLDSSYHIRWKGAPRSMDLGLLYRALEQHQADMVAGSATDGVLAVLDAKVLADDKRVFPPYEACIVVRSATLAAIPELRGVLAELSGKLPTEEMRRLNYEVDGKHHRAAEVARGFLNSQGL